MDTVGGCLTITVCTAEDTIPHVLPVTVTLIEYVPGVIKLNDGFSDDEEVLFT